jgi:hypothetical protein
MSSKKQAITVSPTKPGRRVRLSREDIKFVSQNQKLAGFSGQITEQIATHEPDMNAIAESAPHLGAQIPSPQNRSKKPRITGFGSLPPQAPADTQNGMTPPNSTQPGEQSRNPSSR